MSTPKSYRLGEMLLCGLHIVLAAFLLVISLVVHEVKVPGFSADEGAALGYVLFFGLGLPLLVIAIGTFVASVLSKKKWIHILAIFLIVVPALSILNVWTGLLASVSYLTFAVWTLVRR